MFTDLIRSTHFWLSLTIIALCSCDKENYLTADDVDFQSGGITLQAKPNPAGTTATTASTTTTASSSSETTPTETAPATTAPSEEVATTDETEATEPEQEEESPEYAVSSGCNKTGPGHNHHIGEGHPGWSHHQPK